MVKKKMNGSGRPKGSKNKKKKSTTMVLTVNTTAVIAEVQELLFAIDGKIDSHYLRGFIQGQVRLKTHKKME